MSISILGGPGEHIRYRTTFSSTVYFPAASACCFFALGFLIGRHETTATPRSFFWFLNNLFPPSPPHWRLHSRPGCVA